MAISAAWSGLEDGDDALAACRADRDEAALARSRLVQGIGQLGDDPAPGRGERMPRRERRAVDVELRAVDGAQGRVQRELVLAERRVLPGLHRREHRRRERLVDLVEV